MSNNNGRPLKKEPDRKICVKCQVVKNKEEFEKSPSENNPDRRRNDCKECRKKYAKQRTSKPGFYKKQYHSMSPEQKVEYIRKKSEQNRKRFKTNPEALARKKAYDKSDKGIFNRYVNESKRRGRLKRGIVFELPFDIFSNFINMPCDYCGVSNSRGIDRIDSDKGYIKENCVSCCKICNQMKSNLTLDVFLEHLKKIVKNRGL